MASSKVRLLTLHTDAYTVKKKYSDRIVAGIHYCFYGSTTNNSK